MTAENFNSIGLLSFVGDHLKIKKSHIFAVTYRASQKKLCITISLSWALICTPGHDNDAISDGYRTVVL